MERLMRYQPWGLVLLGIVLTLGGALWWLSQEPGAIAGPDAVATPRDGRETVVRGSKVPEAEKAPRFPGDPLRLQIPDLGVDARVVPILAPGGVLTPPSDPQQLGWWADGARPGEVRGSALVTGHTVSTGGGALDDLEDLDTGDAIRVVSRKDPTDYAVRTVEILDKGDLKRQAKLLFSQAVPGRLVVVTCEDWNGVEYLSNVVVTATPTGDD